MLHYLSGQAQAAPHHGAHPAEHSVWAKMFHWGFVVLYLYAIFKGLDDVSQLDDRALLNFEIGFAIVFLLVLGARFLVMRRRPTALPDHTPKMVLLAARAAHIGIYVSIAMIAVSGLMIAGLFTIGLQQGVLMSLTLGLHNLSIGASYGLLGAHVLASIGHRLVGDGIWSSMVPFWKEDRSN